MFQREGGRVPRTVEVELTEDLVDSCVPVDEVTITGVVKVCSALFYLLILNSGFSLFTKYQSNLICGSGESNKNFCFHLS